MTKRTIIFPTFTGTSRLELSQLRVSLPRAPWDDAEGRPDPRHETNPRFTLVRPVARRISRADAVIAAIREEAGA